MSVTLISFCPDQEANLVELAGTFNNWTRVPMRKGPGHWSISLPLAPGQYQYKFVVDNIWKHDMGKPTADDNMGGRNNVIMVEKEQEQGDKQDSSVVLLTGGCGTSKSVEVFGECDINLPDLPVGREFHSAHYFNKQALICGGDGSAASSCSSLVANTFEHHSNLVEDRKAHAGVVLDQKLFLIGGWRSYGNNNLTSMDSLPTSAMTWSKETGEMEIGRDHACAVATSSTTMLVMGGQPFTNTVEEYNSITGEWRMRAPMLGDGSWGHSCVYLESGDVLVAGGWGGSNLKTAQLYNVASNKWSMTGSMNKERYGAEMVISNGRILIFGGRDSSEALDSVEEYHPDNKSWTILGKHMKTPRFCFSAAVVPRSMFN